MNEITLCEKDLRIIQLFGDGFYAKEISVALNTPQKTIERRMWQLRKKLNARSMPHLINMVKSSIIVLDE